MPSYVLKSPKKEKNDRLRKRLQQRDASLVNGAVYSSFIIVTCDLQFIWGLGVAPEEAECFDVYGLDEDLLEMVPKPVLAVLFLYPLTEKVNSLWNLRLFFGCASEFSLMVSLSIAL